MLINIKFLIILTLFLGCQTTDVSYVGSLKGGYRHGHGTLTKLFGPGKGDIYEGNFLIGYFHGHGKYTWYNGDTYVGNWKKSMRHGKGVMNYKIDGVRYEGLFKEDIRTIGTLFYRNGDKYTGEFKNTRNHKENVKHGKGTYFYLNDNKFKGDIYVGKFKNGNFHGEGKYIRSNGQIIVGIFKKGKLIETLKN